MKKNIIAVVLFCLMLTPLSGTQSKNYDGMSDKTKGVIGLCAGIGGGITFGALSCQTASPLLLR